VSDDEQPVSTPVLQLDNDPTLVTEAGCRDCNWRRPQDFDPSSVSRYVEGQVEDPTTVSQLEREIRERALTAWLMAPDAPEVVQGIVYFFNQRPEWHIQAACRGSDTALFLSGRGRSASTAAIAVCAACLVRDECLDYAMSDIELVGVWGGTTTEERRRLRRAESQSP
jgi:WhiB family redox-sensing transcriptional regulator